MPATFAPLRANATAAALPMPRAAPVTTATLPLRISLQAECCCLTCPSAFPENAAVTKAVEATPMKLLLETTRFGGIA